MDKELELKIALKEDLKEIRSHKRKFGCQIPDCQNHATTTSHILQQSIILNSILDSTGHFYRLEQTDLFGFEKDGSLRFKKASLKNSFKFPLYCKTHDDSIFSNIEKSPPVDWNNYENVLLQTYRTICMEIRKKEIYIDCIKSIAKNRKEILESIDYFDFRPAKLAIKDMTFYKEQIELELFNKPENRFQFDVIRIPLKKVCFSSAISIYDVNNPKTHESNEWGYTKEEALTASFLNFFPYFDESILLVVQHKEHICKWTSDLIDNFTNSDDHNSILSKLLTFRIDQWVIASALFEQIATDRKEEYLKIAQIYSDNFEYDIDSKFRLF